MRNPANLFGSALALIAVASATPANAEWIKRQTVDRFTDKKSVYSYSKSLVNDSSELIVYFHPSGDISSVVYHNSKEFFCSKLGRLGTEVVESVEFRFDSNPVHTDKSGAVNRRRDIVWLHGHHSPPSWEDPPVARERRKVARERTRELQQFFNSSSTFIIRITDTCGDVTTDEFDISGTVDH